MTRPSVADKLSHRVPHRNQFGSNFTKITEGNMAGNNTATKHGSIFESRFLRSPPQTQHQVIDHDGEFHHAQHLPMSITTKDKAPQLNYDLGRTGGRPHEHHSALATVKDLHPPRTRATDHQEHFPRRKLGSSTQSGERAGLPTAHRRTLPTRHASPTSAQGTVFLRFDQPTQCCNF